MTLRVQGCDHKWNCDWKKRGKDKGMVSVQTTVIRLHTSRLEQTLRSCFCRFSVVPHYWCCCKDARCFNHFIALQCVQIILFTLLCGVTYTTFLSFIAAHRSGFSPTSNEIFAPCLCRLFLGGFPHTRHYHQQQQQRPRSGICMFCLLCMFGCSLPAFGGCLVHFRGIVAYSATIFHVNRVMQKKRNSPFVAKCGKRLEKSPRNVCIMLCCVLKDLSVFIRQMWPRNTWSMDQRDARYYICMGCFRVFLLKFTTMRTTGAIRHPPQFRRTEVFCHHDVILCLFAFDQGSTNDSTV